MLHSGAGGHGFVNRLLELDFAAAAVASVLGEDGDAGGVVDAIGDGVGGESAKDDRVNGADARAGEECNGQLRRHAHVDRDAVSFLNAEGFERVGEFLHFGVQFGIGEATDFARLTFPDDGGFVAARTIEMAVETIEAEVELSAYKPLSPGEIPLEYIIPRFKPVEVLCDAGPERFRILDGLLVEGLVLLRGS